MLHRRRTVSQPTSAADTAILASPVPILQRFSFFRVHRFADARSCGLDDSREEDEEDEEEEELRTARSGV